MTQPRLCVQQTDSAIRLDALIKRWDQLVKQKTAEKHHLKAATNLNSIRSIKKFIKAFPTHKHLR